MSTSSAPQTRVALSHHWAVKLATRIRLRLGHVFIGAALIFGPIPHHWGWIIAGALLVAYGIVLRIACAGHIRKDTELATAGPYAHMRNPLYFGSLTVCLGVCALMGSWPALVVVGAAFVAVHWLVILGEEAKLAAHFGADYAQYLKGTPRLWPRPAGLWLPGWFAGFQRKLFCGSKELLTAATLSAVVVCFAIKWWFAWQLPLWGS